MLSDTLNRSSWYSKTKHACEMMMHDKDVYILRIRMPFCNTTSERNIIMKLLKYDNIINEVNSMTCIGDLCEFIMLFMVDIVERDTPGIPYGIYNVVNPKPPATRDILHIMKQYNIFNKNWNMITTEQLLKTTKANRSNCILSSKKIDNLNLSLPDTTISLTKCIERISDQLH